MKTVLILLSVAGAMMAVGLFFWPQESAIDLAYVVPDGYRGELLLYLRAARGMDSRPKGGRLVLDFTQPGKVTVAGFDPLRGWCRQTASFKNGESIEIFRSSATYPAEKVLLDHDAPSTDAPTVSHIFVGTSAEIVSSRRARYEKLMKKK